MKIVNGIYLPDRDKHFSEQILQSPLFLNKGTYQYPKIVSGLEYCGRHRTAIDIGANVGLWSRVLAFYFEKVVAIEPICENVECLRENTKDLDNVAIIETAISPTRGILALKLVKDVATSCVVFTEDSDVEVLCRPLDDFYFRDVDFIKIDVEGYEHQVVLSSEQTIRRWKPTIVVEQKKKRLIAQGNDKNQPTVRLLESWGMREVWAKSGDHCLVWE